MIKGKWTNSFKQGVDLKDGTRPQPGSGRIPRSSGGSLYAGVQVPRPSPFSTKHSIRKELARFVTPGDGTGATGTFTLSPFIYTPSTRLRIGITVCIEPDNQSAPDAAFVVQPTWHIRAMARDPETGRETALQNVYPVSGSANLPDAFEADSSSMLLRADVVITDTAFAAAYCPNTQRASLVCFATWEPNVPIADVELQQLYDKCSLQFGPPKLITNNAS